MKKLAVITARGGSKRIPKKNILSFDGQPIIAYSIKAALESGVFDEVMVSTDDETIAQIALQYGAKVPFMRSEKTANDFAGTVDVLFEVLDEYEKRGEKFDIICCLYPTAPFVTKEKLDKAMKAFEESNADTLLPVVRYSYPPQRALVAEDNRLKLKYPEHVSSRSQDLEPWYHDAGQFYIMKVESLRRNKFIIMGDIVPFELSELEVQDIDNMTDWEIAEIKYRYMKDSVSKED